VMLGIAYACSVGGAATLVGTPPNLSFARIFAITFPAAPPISFAQWMLMGLPIALLMLAAAWLMITKVLYRVPGHISVDRSMIAGQHAALGRVTFEEGAVLAVFGLTALLWVFRVPLDLGVVTLPGWSGLLPRPDYVDDGTVAIAMASVLFLIPTRSPDADTPMVMGPDVIPRLPWNIVLLFGGGFALAHGFQATGLSVFIGDRFQGLEGTSPWLFIPLVCLAITFLTELTSNTATTEMILPILAAVSVAAEIHPLLLMIPATLSGSCAFMMPVATPPNAIVFGSERLRISDMARAGLILNLIGAVVITLVFMLVGTAVFGIEAGLLPSWAAVSG
ncbi:MAG: SLC13/DASS family transporter, partial [Gemmatimonadetes bacterium]|nr:SLC13/DASS family transporter [Gemmatimonadota bacterium]